MAKATGREFYGKGYVIFLPRFTPSHGEPFDGYLMADICPKGNFPLHELYAASDINLALEMNFQCASEWLRDHPRRVRSGAKAVER
jgi:hypothetical protein